MGDRPRRKEGAEATNGYSQPIQAEEPDRTTGAAGAAEATQDTHALPDQVPLAAATKAARLGGTTQVQVQEAKGVACRSSPSWPTGVYIV
jgi:hypothetical protein